MLFIPGSLELLLLEFKVMALTLNQAFIVLVLLELLDAHVVLLDGLSQPDFQFRFERIVPCFAFNANDHALGNLGIPLNVLGQHTILAPLLLQVIVILDELLPEPEVGVDEVPSFLHKEERLFKSPLLALH